MLDSLIDLISDAWWTYPFLFLFALLDSIIPIVPSETAVIAAGVVAGSGGLSLPAVILVAERIYRRALMQTSGKLTLTQAWKAEI